jgi:hypothetical protein
VERRTSLKDNCGHMAQGHKDYNGLPKLQKLEVPVRPVITTIGTPPYRLAEHLPSLMGPHLRNTSHKVRNEDFACMLDTLRVITKDILVIVLTSIRSSPECRKGMH